MINRVLLSFLLMFFAVGSFAQTNILCTNPLAAQILEGNYNPNDYMPSTIINMHGDIAQGIQNNVSTDSLKSYLFQMNDFENRNTGSDTLSATRGIGAARKWTFEKFQLFSSQSENRLVTSYLQFDRDICGMQRHKNIFTVLPGIDTSDKSIIILEAHIDSRCETACDTACLAQGMEDNGSGTALVLELARVMSQYTFNHTIVFMATIGEEQGLFGADAFADYCVQNGIEVKAVLNNDVIGGIICGETSSPPSCPGVNHIDSTQVRIFSNGGGQSVHKGLARFVKLEYQEELLPYVNVPMLITIMSAEDRTGRGGDHIPFRQQGYTAIRFTSANEHGDASNGPAYHDRQHTHNDILGIDTNGDQVIDSFFVNFNYLSRNAKINGNAAAMAAIGPKSPEFSLDHIGGVIKVDITDSYNYGVYRVGYRTNTNDFDTVYTITTLNMDIPVPQNDIYYISVASVDSNGVESLFARERRVIVNSTAVGEVVDEDAPDLSKNIFLHQNRPNPFDEATMIGFDVKKMVDYDDAYISIRDMKGVELQRLPVELQEGINEVLYTHGYAVQGVFVYSLIIDNQVIDTRRMIFAF